MGMTRHTFFIISACILSLVLLSMETAHCEDLSPDELAFAQTLLQPANVTNRLSADISPETARKALALLNHKTLVLAAVKNNGLDVKYASAKMRDDRDVMMQAVRQNGLALRYASSRLKDDRKLVQMAVTNNSSALQFAGARSRDDTAVVRIAVQRTNYIDSNALQYASNRLKSDKQIVLLALRQENSDALQFADDSLKHDRQVILAARSGLKYASEPLKNEKTLVLEMLRKYAAHCNAIVYYAGERLQQDVDFLQRVFQKKQCTNLNIVLNPQNRKNTKLARLAVQHHGKLILLFDESIRNSREIVKLAIKNDPDALEYAGEQLKKDKSVVLAALAKNASLLRFADVSLRNNPDVVLAAIKKSPTSFAYAGKRLKKDRSFVLLAIQNGANALRYADQSLMHDRQLLLASIKQSDWLFNYGSIPIALKKDKVILHALSKHQPREASIYLKAMSLNRADVLAAVKQLGKALKYVADHFKRDREIVLAALHQNGYALKYADKALQRNKALIKAAVMTSPDMIRYYKKDKNLTLDRDTLLAMLAKSAFYFKNIPKHFKQDKAIVMAAIHAKSEPLDRVDKDMVVDDQIINGLIDNRMKQKDVWEFVKPFYYLSKPIASRTRMLRLLSKNPLTLEYASKALKQDRQLVLKAIHLNGDAIAFTDSTLQEDKAIARVAINRSASAFDYIAPSLQTDPAMAQLAVLKGNRHVLQRLSGLPGDNKRSNPSIMRVERELSKRFNVKATRLQMTGIPDYETEKNRKEPVFVISPDGSRLAAILHLRPQNVSYVAIWNAQNGRLLYTHRLPDDYTVSMLYQITFTPDSKTLVAANSGFIWRFAKGKKPVYCYLDSGVRDINNNAAIIHPNDWVDGVYDLDSCDPIVLASSMDVPYLAIGAKNRLLMVSPTALEKDHKDVLLYRKKPETMEHFTNYKDQVELWEIPATDSMRQAKAEIIFHYPEKQLLVLRYNQKNNLQISKWDYLKRRLLWRNTIKTIKPLASFIEKKNYFLDARQYQYQVDFTHNRLYIGDTRYLRSINLNNGRILKKQLYKRVKQDVYFSDKKSAFFQSVLQQLALANIETLEIRPEKDSSRASQALHVPFSETIKRVSVEGGHKFTLWQIKARD